jgi:hypothetical protein
MPSAAPVPVLVLVLVSGCYAYAPIEPANVRPGTGVRARVSGAAADRIAPLLGTSNPRLLNGRLVDVQGDTMIVEVPTVLQASVGSSVETLHQRIAISRSELLELETRRLDRFRTAALAGAVAVVVGTVVITALDGEPGSRGPPGGGGPEARLPAWRVRF